MSHNTNTFSLLPSTRSTLTTPTTSTMNKKAAREEYLRGDVTPALTPMEGKCYYLAWQVNADTIGSWIDAGRDSTPAFLSPNSPTRVVPESAPANKDATPTRPSQNSPKHSQTTVYIDIEEDLSLESVILEYNGLAPPRDASPSHNHPLVASSDEENILSNSIVREFEYDSGTEDGGSDDEDGASQILQSRRHFRRSTVSTNQRRSDAQSPSAMDLRASFSTLLHGNYRRNQKSATGSADGAGDSAPIRSSSVRLNTVCLVPESDMNQHRGPSFKSERPDEPVSRSRAATTTTTTTTSSSSRSPKSSRSSSSSSCDHDGQHHRRRRKRSGPGYNSGGGPFGQVDLSTVSLAAAGISLVAGLSFSAGYALGRRSDVHLTVAS